MDEHSLFELALIVVAGIAAQWIGWRLRIPSILFLLAAGFLAGPIFGVVHVDELFGHLLHPVVALSVAIILFEGGLSLRWHEMREGGAGGVVLRLVTLGVLCTIGVATLAAHYLLGMDWPQALLLGAVLSVTGPTVVNPLIRQIRPRKPVGSVLKWEGIVIDPVGAVLSVLVFEAILAGSVNAAPGIIAFGVLWTLVVGFGLGGLAAGLLIFFLRRYWIPDYLQNAIALGLVVAAFAASNHLQPESGLLTATVMGVIMANQPWVSIWHLVEFKENLRVLILSVIFVMLASRIDIAQLEALGWGAAVFVLVLLFVARPLAVAVCTGDKAWRDWWSEERVTYRQKRRRPRADKARDRDDEDVPPADRMWPEAMLFMSWMAPRGIVAAAISSVFALRLADAGFEGAEMLVPVTFLVIGSTVLIYGLTAEFFARGLGLSTPDPQGVIMVGAHAFAREVATVLLRERVTVKLIDTNWSNITIARQENIDSTFGDALSEPLLDRLDLHSLGRVLALTANSETNALAMLHFAELFDRAELYQLSAGQAQSRSKDEAQRPKHFQGRTLFGRAITYDFLRRRMTNGSTIKATKLTEEFGFQNFREQYGDEAVPLFILTPRRNNHAPRVLVCTAGAELDPQPGQTVVSLVPPRA